MKLKNILFVTLACISVFGFVMQANAGNTNKLGTAAAQELLIPVGSRGTALGGAYSAGINGIDAIYWNPAGLANTPSSAEAMVSYMNYIAGINLAYVAAGAKTGIGWVGVSIKSLSFGDIPVTTEDAPDGTGASFTPNFMTVGITYSRAMTDRIMFGTSAKIISETIADNQATGLAFDMGVQYITSVGIKLGVTMKNYGTGMRFSGPELERQVYLPDTEPNTPPHRLAIPSMKMELPSLFEIGLSYELKPMQKSDLVVAANFTNNNFGSDKISGGAEFSFNNMFFLRGSYTYQTTVASEDNLWGPAFGFGFRYGIGGHAAMIFDYTYRSVQYFGGNHLYTLKFTF